MDAATTTIDTTGARIFARREGTGPPLLLLHGFPETHLMWREVAHLLAGEFTVVCADLRGYGQSSCPSSDIEHAPYSKRAMARDMVDLMEALGFERFCVAGHDRGGRVAYRAALDHPERVDRLAALDILPIDVSWARADVRLMLGFWPWTLLAQPAPLPEKLLQAAPGAVLDSALGGEWGTPAETFDADLRDAYLAALADPDHVHAICEEYRAAASIDREHDRADRLASRRIRCPTLALWSEHGPLSTWYADVGGPLELWRQLAEDIAGRPVSGGHFFPEEHPVETAHALGRFFSPSAAAEQHADHERRA